MNISARQSELLYALKVLGTVATTKTALPILGSVYIETDGKSIRLQATDLTTTATVDVSCANPHQAIRTERACIPLKDFRNAVKDCIKREGRKGVDPWVNLDWTGCDVTVAGSMRFTIAGCKWEDFPEYKESASGSVCLSYTNLDEALTFVSPAICLDETRFHLSSVAFIGSDLVTTDGLRLHRAMNMPNVDGSYLVPRGAIKTLQTAMERKPDKVFAWFHPWLRNGCQVTQKGGVTFQMHANGCDTTIACALVDAAFPPYEQVIPSNPGMAFTMNREALESVCQAAKKSAAFGHGLGFDMESPNYIRASVAGKMAISMPAKIKGKTAICVNPGYLLDVVSVMSQDTVTIRHGEEMGPIRIDGPNQLAVIMPMRRD